MTESTFSVVFTSPKLTQMATLKSCRSKMIRLLSAPINRSIRCLNGASLAELFWYTGTIVTSVNGVSYGGWIPKEEEFEKTNFIRILQLT